MRHISDYKTVSFAKRQHLLVRKYFRLWVWQLFHSAFKLKINLSFNKVKHSNHPPFFGALCRSRLKTFEIVNIRMRNEGLCTELIRVIQQYFALLPFDQGVHAHQSGLQPKFSGLCTRTDQSHLVVFSIDRNAIGCYDFVSIAMTRNNICIISISLCNLLNPLTMDTSLCSLMQSMYVYYLAGQLYVQQSLRL